MVSNCPENQAGRLAATRHGVPLFSIALRMVSRRLTHSIEQKATSESILEPI